ncbi:hypothetical protein HNY73_005985 [Argiope bruennichi]|uniref:MULE transposase domain-containing protein n=1 Tax=Argiope bruennichi TaxID=94029 RepID=A0A8T0FJE2_ARGBR|nr:hypothetical protein HNY73_005985 [Argiope bruennichi]
MCAALAFLPEEDLDDTWIKIMEDSPQHCLLTKFYNYFVDQWFENSTITVDMWNHYNRLHRTNNAIEGWHNKINLFIEKSHPKIEELIRFLKREAEYSDFLAARKELNLEGKHRAEKYINLDNRLMRTVLKYSIDKDLKSCLVTLANATKLL